MSCISSEGVTPPSSLLRTHAPNHNPPADFGFPLFGRSWQVAVSPCWKMVLPDVISTICVKALGPMPRRVPVGLFRLVRQSSSDRTPRPQDIGLRPSVQELGTRDHPCNATSTGGVVSGLQSFTNVQAPLLARPPGCTYRCVKHRAAGPFTSRNAHVVFRLGYPRFYMNRDIATYPKRNKLTRRDFHPLDCGLVGRYRTPDPLRFSTLLDLTFCDILQQAFPSDNTVVFAA